MFVFPYDSRNTIKPNALDGFDAAVSPKVKLIYRLPLVGIKKLVGHYTRKPTDLRPAVTSQISKLYLK